LSEPLKKVLAQRNQFGHRVIHIGWERICKAAGWPAGKDPEARNPEARNLYSFIINDVGAWFASLRPQREPGWPEEPDFWPRLQEGGDWERIESDGNCCGNSFSVIVRVPRPGLRKLTIAANLRGYLPAKAQAIEPLDVANGLSRFLPNQQIVRVARNQPQKTFLKLQAMCLTKRGDKILAHISATQMTQLLHSSEAGASNAEGIRLGERLGVLHLYPGGRRLGQFVLFERCPEHPGWKQLPVEEITADTRFESYEQRVGKRVHARSQRKMVSGFVVLDETSHLLERARLEKFCLQARPQFNAPLPHSVVGSRTNLAVTHYRQVAARIASLCRYNRIGYVLIAGFGRIVASIKQRDGSKPLFLAAPTPKFFTVHRSGSQCQLHGFLLHALEKSGVTPLLASGRARNIWVKPYLLNRMLDGCVVCVPYHEDAAGEKRRVYSGKRTLIAPDEESLGYAYPLSACWAILLDWSRPDFTAHVDHLCRVTEEP
jgi:hypothetical protein